MVVERSLAFAGGLSPDETEAQGPNDQMPSEHLMVPNMNLPPYTAEEENDVTMIRKSDADLKTFHGNDAEFSAFRVGSTNEDPTGDGIRTPDADNNVKLDSQNCNATAKPPPTPKPFFRSSLVDSNCYLILTETDTKEKTPLFNKRPLPVSAATWKEWKKTGIVSTKEPGKKPKLASKPADPASAAAGSKKKSKLPSTLPKMENPVGNENLNIGTAELNGGAFTTGLNPGASSSGSSLIRGLLTGSNVDPRAFESRIDAMRNQNTNDPSMAVNNYVAANISNGDNSAHHNMIPPPTAGLHANVPNAGFSHSGAGDGNGLSFATQNAQSVKEANAEAQLSHLRIGDQAEREMLSSIDDVVNSVCGGGGGDAGQYLSEGRVAGDAACFGPAPANSIMSKPTPPSVARLKKNDAAAKKAPSKKMFKVPLRVIDLLAEK